MQGSVSYQIMLILPTYRYSSYVLRLQNGLY